MTNVNFKSLAKYLLATVPAVFLTACGGNGPSTPKTSVANLKGSYVFSVVGTDPTDGDYAVVGSFVTDGKGNITSAVADYNLGSGIDADVPLTGTYTVSGSAVTVTLTDSMSVKDSFTTTLPGTAATAPIANFDSTGSGTLYTQVESGFTPIGAYAYTITGEEQDTVTGSGQFVVGPGDTYTGGILSYTDGPTTTSYASVTGFLDPPEANGRGQAALVGNNLAYYVIGPSQILMIGLDERALLVIPAQKQ